MDPTIQPTVELTIPPKTYNGFTTNLYSTALSNLKNGIVENDFKIAITKMIDIIDPNDVKYNENIVAFVCETIEHVITKRKSGKQKEKIVVEILSKYFNYDDVLVKKFIQLVLPRITKSNVFRRVRNRLNKFFF